MWFLKWTSSIHIFGKFGRKETLRPHPRSLSQKLLGWDLEICVFISPPGNSDAWSTLRNKGLSHSVSVQFHDLSLPRYFSFCALVFLWLPTSLFGIIINCFLPESPNYQPLISIPKGVKKSNYLALRWFKISIHRSLLYRFFFFFFFFAHSKLWYVTHWKFGQLNLF